MAIKILLIILLVMNLVTFIVYGVDKAKARRGSWRIPESVLIGLAVFLGSIGALAGMFFFHHKTRKPKFMIGVPVILVVQIILVVVVRRLM